MFSTERLRLRAYTESDFPTLLAIVNNVQVQSTLISEHVVPRSARLAIKLEEIANEALLYVVLEAVDRDGEVIGAASITVESPKNRDVTLGIGILPSAWNKGYGTEAINFLVDYAFRSLGVHRVSLNVIESNAGTVALYKKNWVYQRGQKAKKYLVKWHMAG